MVYNKLVVFQIRKELEVGLSLGGNRPEDSVSTTCAQATPEILSLKVFALAVESCHSLWIYPQLTLPAFSEEHTVLHSTITFHKTCFLALRKVLFLAFKPHG